MLQSRHLVGAVMRNLREGMREDDIIDLIAAKASSRPGRGWTLPSGTDADAFLDLLTHRGALQRRKDNSVHCPIPSFRSILIEEGKSGPGSELESADPAKSAKSPVRSDPDNSSSPF